jgi:hypothetical protein
LDNRFTDLLKIAAGHLIGSAKVFSNCRSWRKERHRLVRNAAIQQYGNKENIIENEQTDGA